MKSVVLDASIFIDHLKGRNGNFTSLLKLAKEGNYQLFIPTAVVVEIFVGYEFLQKEEEKQARILLQDFKRVDLTEEIAEFAAKIGRENKLGFIGTIDLVVAATALILDGELATQNVKHFRHIPNLRLLKIPKSNPSSRRS